MQSTRVVLSNNVRWATPAQLADKQERLTELFEQYRRAWVDFNLDDLQVLYNDGAWPLAAKQHGLNANLKRVSQGNTEESRSRHALTLADLDTDTLSLLSVPNAESADDPFILMSFRHGAKNEIKTSLYWRELETGQWQIVHERSDNTGV